MIEGYFLVVERRHGGFADPGDKRFEVRGTGQVGRQREIVEEHADDRFKRRRSAIGGARPDKEMLIAGEPMDERLEDRAQRRMRRHALPPAERLHTRGERVVDPKADRVAAKALGSGPRTIGGQVQHLGHRSKPRGPECKLPAGVVAIDPAPLDKRHVGGMPVRCRQGRGFSDGDRPVECEKVAQQDHEGPAIMQQMMLDVDEHVPIRRQAEKPPTDKGKRREIEGPGSLGTDPRADLVGGRRLGFERHRPRGVHPLAR